MSEPLGQAPPTAPTAPGSEGGDEDLFEQSAVAQPGTLGAQQQQEGGRLPESQITTVDANFETEQLGDDSKEQQEQERKRQKVGENAAGMAPVAAVAAPAAEDSRSPWQART